MFSVAWTYRTLKMSGRFLHRISSSSMELSPTFKILLKHSNGRRRITFLKALTISVGVFVCVSLVAIVSLFAVNQNSTMTSEKLVQNSSSENNNLSYSNVNNTKNTNSHKGRNFIETDSNQTFQREDSSLIKPKNNSNFNNMDDRFIILMGGTHYPSNIRTNSIEALGKNSTCRRIPR